MLNGWRSPSLVVFTFVTLIHFLLAVKQVIGRQILTLELIGSLLPSVCA
jgi:hypothetical protein